MIADGAMLDVPQELVVYVSRLLGAHRLYSRTRKTAGR